jgi:hypothetical protein
MRILVLRIYNSTPEYDLMYQHHFVNDESIFVCYNEKLNQPWKYDPNKRLIELKGTESKVPGVLDKTMKGLEICLGLFDFDVLVRSNISTVINLKELESQINHLPSVYGGHPWVLDWFDWKFGINHETLPKYRHTEFISGTSIVLSRNHCQFLVQNKNKLDYSIVDDVSIGYLMKEKGGVNFRSYYSEKGVPEKNVCFYRFCGEDRIKDANSISRLYRLFKY